MQLKPLRSLLFVPATSTHLLAKATTRGADALIVDLEDSIPLERKTEARPLAVAAVRELAARGATVALRVNADPAMYAADLEHMPLDLLTVILLPKVESAAQVDQLAMRLGEIEARLGAPAVPVAALIETPRGVLASASIALGRRLVTLGFGCEDYAAALGVAPEPAALTWPAQQVLTAAHAFGLQSWGLAASIAVIDDIESFAVAVRAARAMGFTGSVCIHPRQVEICNKGFGPTADELTWAARVIQADEAARAAGRGAVLLDGRMIDLPIVERARRLLAAAR